MILISFLGILKKGLSMGISKMKFYSYRSQIQKGKNLRIIGNCSLYLGKSAKIYIGDNCTIVSGIDYNPIGRNIHSSFFLAEGAELCIGNHVGISDASLRVHKKIEIGNNVNVGADTIIMDSDGHSKNYLDRRDPIYLDKKNKVDKPIIIEDDVLIGTRCIVCKGVTIGARSIIGAGSVVVKDIPKDCIAAGNPCKVIKLINK